MRTRTPGKTPEHRERRRACRRPVVFRRCHSCSENSRRSLSTQVHGDGSQGDGHEIQFSARPDNNVAHTVARPSPRFLLFFFFLLPFRHCSTALYYVFLSSLDPGSLFIRVALKNALYLSLSLHVPVHRCCKLLPLVVILAHT